VYENKRVLPLGFMTDSSIKDWQTKDATPFDVQNQFIRDAAGIDATMFENVPITSVDRTYMDYKPVREDEDNQKDINNEFKYTLTNPANISLEPTVTATIQSDKDQYLFIYVDAGNAKRVKYQTNTANEDRELSAGKSLFDIGHVVAGETINVKFSLTNRGEFEKTYRKDGTVKIYVASYNDDVFQQAYDKLAQNTFDITTFEDTYIDGTIDAGNGGVMFTSIPYCDGWSVKVDGQSVDKVSIASDGVIGVDLGAGVHEVEFKFKPQGLAVGIVVSLISIIALVVYTLFDKKYNKIKVTEVTE
jgi:uncharacterized membrane protein YfhO